MITQKCCCLIDTVGNTFVLRGTISANVFICVLVRINIKVQLLMYDVH